MTLCELNQELKLSFECYLLGELSPNDMAAIEKHLATGCSSCLQEIKELQEIFASIACSAPSVTPPEQIRQKLLSRLQTEVKAQPSLKLVPMPKRAWYKTPLSLLGKVAASLGLLILLAETVFLVHINKKAVLQAELAKVQEHKIQILQTELNQKQKDISNIETSIKSSRKLIALDSKLISKASGKALWDTDQNAWQFYISDLPNAPKGRTYQLWFITDKELISGGTFQTNEKGSMELRLATPRNCKNILEVAISLEPIGGSETPTGAIYLSGPII
ncbi:MAG: anti-sigma factor [Acidobacteria bacterium]|nr:anti-sigma factor [Acidobacteriota bacterium]